MFQLSTANHLALTQALNSLTRIVHRARYTNECLRELERAEKVIPGAARELFAKSTASPAFIIALYTSFEEGDLGFTDQAAFERFLAIIEETRQQLLPLDMTRFEAVFSRYRTANDSGHTKIHSDD